MEPCKFTLKRLTPAQRITTTASAVLPMVPRMSSGRSFHPVRIRKLAAHGFPLWLCYARSTLSLQRIMIFILCIIVISNFGKVKQKACKFYTNPLMLPLFCRVQLFICVMDQHISVTVRQFLLLGDSIDGLLGQIPFGLQRAYGIPLGSIKLQ